MHNELLLYALSSLFPSVHTGDCTCTGVSLTLPSWNFLLIILVIILVLATVLYVTVRRRPRNVVNAAAAVEEETVEHTPSEMVCVRRV